MTHKQPKKMRFFVPLIFALSSLVGFSGCSTISNFQSAADRAINQRNQIGSPEPISADAISSPQNSISEITETLTPSTESQRSVTNSFDGELIISLDGQATIISLSLDDNQQRQLLDFVPVSLAFSPDGRRLAYLANGMVYIKDFDLNKTAQFVYKTSGNFPGNMAWSPDGTLIGFGCYSELTFHRELCLLNVENGERQEITNYLNLGVQSNGGMDGVDIGNWSNDGNKIVFITRILPEGGGHAWGIIQLYHTTDDSIQTILDETTVQEPFRLANPSISPDGNTILFSAKSGEYYAIYRVNSDGSQLERATLETYKFNITNPIWSPEGTYFVAYAQNQTIQESYGSPTIFNLNGEMIAQVNLEGRAVSWISTNH